jgi:hypothetical protein
VWTVAQTVLPSVGGSTITLLAGLAGVIVTGIVLYGLGSLCLKSAELKEILIMFKITSRK